MMKQFKKMLVLLLALAMSISIMAAPSFADENQAKIELAVTTSAEEDADLKSGDTLTATITAPAPAETVANGQLQMNFNKDILQASETGLTGSKGTLVISNADDANTNGYVNAMFYDASGDEFTLEEPVVLTVKFTVKEKVYEGSYKDLITVDKENTFFSKADDTDVDVEFGNTSFDADLEGEWKLDIPAGATFDEIWTDIDTETEKARIAITDTGLKFDGDGPVYVITVPETVNKVYFKWIKASGKPCVGWGVGEGWDYPQQKSPSPGKIEDRINNDEYQQIGIDPSTAMLEDYDPDDPDDSQMAHVYKLWSDSWGNLVGLTFEYSCDHNDVDHVEAVEATCTSEGNIEYWKCNDCGRYFSDKKLRNRITEAQTVTEPIPHDYDEDQVCTMCNTRGTTKVEFSGVSNVAERVYDKSDDTENSGLDYNFKVTKGIVSYRYDKDLVDLPYALGITSSPKGQSQGFKQDEQIEYNGYTVDNYSIHKDGWRDYICGRDCAYDLINVANGSKIDGSRYYATMPGSVAAGQYVVVDRNEPAVPLYGLYLYRDNNSPEFDLEAMTADEDGVYTIPASKMKADATVKIYVDKWPSSFVKFEGDGAYKVTDATKQDENAGEDFKFKAGNGIVSMGTGEDAEEMTPDEEGFYTIPGSMMKANETITVTVAKPPSSFVEFVGDGAYKVTDATEQDENAGKDFTFKAGDGIVSEDLEIVDTPVDTLKITNPEHLTFAKKGTVKIKGDDEDVPVDEWAEYEVPDYDVYVSGSFRLDHLRVGGVDSDKYENRIYRSNNINKYTETAVTRAGGEYIVFYEHDIQGSHSGGWHRKEFKPLFRMTIKEGSPIMTPDEDGVYTIPAERMLPNETIRIRVEKHEHERAEDKVDEIGEVTLEKEDAIVAAREALEALSDEERALYKEKSEQTLINAELKLETLKLQKENDEQGASLDAANALIETLKTQLNELKQSSEADEKTIADLENQLEELQSAADALAESTATKEELTNEINSLNSMITDLQDKLDQQADAQQKMDGKMKEAVDEINKYVEDNLPDIYDEDKLDVEIAALKGIIAVKDAEKEDDIKSAVDKVKAAIDEKVQIKADTEAAKALKVTGLKAKAKSKKFTVSWKQNADAEAYQVQYKLKSAKKFSNLKKSTTAVKVTSKKLKKGKKYIFQVRTIKKVNGKAVYGAWVKTKAVKCK